MIVLFPGTVVVYVPYRLLAPISIPGLMTWSVNWDVDNGDDEPLEEVGGYIDSVIQDQKMGVELETYTADLMKNASIEIYAEEFTDLLKAWAEGVEGAPAGTPGRGR